MCASRILILARTMRWATVDGAVRKARAISSVVRPQTSRNVSAICASGGRAGWQQVKINRNRSSSTRSEEHTSELQSQSNIVCRLLLEKKLPGHASAAATAVRGRHLDRAEAHVAHFRRGIRLV